jgi:HEAT repeat protein/cyclophilin family peptidyl-prolyl cis-trans isomerase
VFAGFLPRRLVVALVIVCNGIACASTTSSPVRTAPAPVPAVQPFEQKVALILRLEDQRVLRDPSSSAAVAAQGNSAGTPVFAPDLGRLLTDSEARVRRRAALAVGRVGLPDGVPLLTPLLNDADPEVRQMAAFALGLIGDRSARDPLVTALSDESPLVQGSACEALGLIGDPAAAAPIGALLTRLLGVLSELPAEADESRRDTPPAAFRLGLEALVRLKAYDALAAAVLDASGQPRVRWWPAAFALGRLEDKRALPALLTLAGDSSPYTKAFAAKGLGALRDRSAVPVLLPLLTGSDSGAQIESIRALGRIGDPAAAQPLLRIAQGDGATPQARLEALAALGSVRAAGVADALVDMLSDRSPAIRAAALRSSAALDPDGFVAVLSGLDADPDWRVRIALASILSTLPTRTGLPRLNAMLADTDQRVVAAVLNALVKIGAPNAGSLLLDHLSADDPVVRAAAAAGLGELRAPAGAQALPAAYQYGLRDSTYVARAAVVDAFAKYGITSARSLLDAALADKDWAVRVRAAALLKQADPAVDTAARVRPAPSHLPPETYQAARLVAPPVSTQAYIETDRGTIVIELAVLDAPLTVENFSALVRKGFFTGLTFHRVVPNFVVQAGDPRGDGEGGPGYTIRDEINERPYLRGTVGMALDWADTGGSQFFITHSPAPHLDAKYTAFGRVISGMDVVDQIQEGDVIRRVRVWDGQEMSGEK